MVNARSDLTNLAPKCRREYEANQTEKLRKAKLENANDYWKLLKGKIKPQTTHLLSNTEFYYYFIIIYNPVIENIHIDFIDKICHCMKLAD